MSAHDVPVQMFMLLHALPALTNQEAKCVGIFFSEFVRFVEVYRVSLLAAAFNYCRPAVALKQY